MNSPRIASHVRTAGLSLRRWRDQTITSYLGGPTPAQHASILVGVFLAALSVGLVADVITGSWLALGAAAVVLAAIVILRGRRGQSIDSLRTQAPWWALVPLAAVHTTTSLPWAPLVTTLLGLASGLTVDVWLRTNRHTPIRTGLAAVTAAAATAWLGGVGGVVGLLCWGAYLAWCVQRLQAYRPRALDAPPPPDLPLLASLKWGRLVAKDRRRVPGRRRPPVVPFYATLARVAGKNSEAFRQVAIKQEGLAAEFASAIALADLPKGYRIIHDVILPGAKAANLDHVGFGPTAAIVFDTKAYGNTAYPTPVGFVQGRYAYQDSQGVLRDLGEAIAQTLWGAVALADALGGVPVRVIMLVHHAAVQEGLVAAAQGRPEVTVAVTDVEHLADYVTCLPIGMDTPWDKAQIKEAVGHAHTVLESASGTEVVDLPALGHGRPLSGTQQPAPLLLYPIGRTAGQVDPVPAPRPQGRP